MGLENVRSAAPKPGGRPVGRRPGRELATTVRAVNALVAGHYLARELRRDGQNKQA